MAQSVTFENRYQDGEYLAETGNWHEDDAAWKADHILSMIGETGLMPERIVDIGCGSGGVLVDMQSKLPPSIDFTGFEIAAPAFALAQPRGNAKLRFVNQSAEEAKDTPYDLALMLDIFEHVPDYLGFLETMRSVANRFIFHIPLDISVRSVLNNLPIYRRDTVGHLHYFTAPTARATLHDSGYRIVEERFTHAKMQPPPTGWKAKLRAKPDQWLFAMSPERCATWLGGCSLLVLAEPV